MSQQTHKAISIRQPWAWLIVMGFKPIENRQWTTNYRGRLLIHAGLKHEPHPVYWERDTRQFTYGAIVGHVDLVDVVREHSSPYFTGPFGWVLANPKCIKPIKMRGHQGLFNVTLELPE